MASPVAPTLRRKITLVARPSATRPRACTLSSAVHSPSVRRTIPRRMPTMEVARHRCCAACTDPNALNYASDVAEDDGTCMYIVLGCMSPLAWNFDSGHEGRRIMLRPQPATVATSTSEAASG